MRPFRRTDAERRLRGTATTETLLVIPVLLLVVVLAPRVAHLFLDALVTRAEAHRDTFAKTTSFVLMPEAMMDNHVNSLMSAQFGALTPSSRRHAFAEFPPDVPPSINAALDAPEALEIPLGPFSLELCTEGYPNSVVEGWGYTAHSGSIAGQQPVHLMAYGAVIRSPWTKLGWPWVATQDIMWEPKQMQDWQGAQERIDDDMRERYKLAE